MGEGRLHKALLILLALVAVGLRALWLDWQPLWWDEGYSFYAAGMPVVSMIRETAEDIHPPLYYALLHFWQGIVGSSPVSARLFSVCVGVLTLILVVRMAHYLGGVKLAVVAGLIATLNPFQVYYSREVRMYALAALFGLASTYLMWLWLDRAQATNGAGGRGLLLAYGLTMLACLYTHYYAAFIPVAQWVFVLLSRERRRVLKPWLVCQVAVAILYLPWIIFTVSKLTSYVGGKVAIERYSSLPPWVFVWQHMSAFSVGHLPAQVDWLSWSGLLFLALVMLGVLRLRSAVKQAAPAILLPVWLVVSLVGAYVINVVYPFNPPGFERLLLFAAPAWGLLVAIGCLDLWERRRVLGALAVVAVLGLSSMSLSFFYTTPRYTQDDYRGLMDQVRAWAEPGDAVLCLYPWQIGYFRAYYDADVLHLEPAFRQDWPARQNDPKLLPGYLDALIHRYGRVWFPAHQTGGRILETEIQAYLAQHTHTLISEWANPHTRLFLFNSSGSTGTAEVARNFGGTVQLVAQSITSAPVAAGQAINVGLYWQLSTPPKEPLYVGLRLVDDTDYTWSQRSAEPVAGNQPFSSWSVGSMVTDLQGLLAPADTPPGRYAVRVGVYQKSNDRGLDIVEPNGVPQGVEVNLGSVDIVQAAQPPQAGRIAIQHRLVADFDDRQGAAIRLIGYNLIDTAFSPGSTLRPDLIWQPLTKVVQDGVIQLQLVNPQGRVIAESDGSSTLARFPMHRWVPGYALRDPQRLIVPPDAALGAYHLRVVIAQSPNGPRFRVKNGDSLDLTSVEVSEGRSHDFALPAVPHPLTATLGSEVQLLGYGPLPEKITPGQTIDLTLYWQALAAMHTSYTVFIHLLDKDEHLWGQVDSLPGNGTLPTTGWIAGEYLRDTYSFRVKPDIPPGVYRVELGLYDAVTGQRQLVHLADQTGEASRVLLETALVVAQP